LRRYILLFGVLVGVAAICWLLWRNAASRQIGGETSAVTIEKEPINFASRTFDPANPPAEMPPMVPGEEAVCDSNFLSNVNVVGRTLQTDGARELVTITQIKVTLRLNITIWVPNDASEHVIEHEDGHRAISEYYYQGADKIAERIAAGYIGKKELISSQSAEGTDLQTESNQWLSQTGTEITDEYNAELNPGPAQQRYDLMTDYSRNDVVAKDAVAQVLKDAAAASSGSAANTGN
jgi:hypothetical protein